MQNKVLHTDQLLAALIMLVSAAIFISLDVALCDPPASQAILNKSGYSPRISNQAVFPGRSAFKILLIESVLALFLPVVSANSKRYHAAAVKSKS